MLDDQVKTGLRSLRYLAENGPRMSMPEVLGQKLIPSVYCAELTVDGQTWIVCYGLEVHANGAHRHLSISNIDRCTLPAPDVFMAITKELGWGLTEVYVHVTKYNNRGLTAQATERVE
jgi:hypothetical protein